MENLDGVLFVEKKQIITVKFIEFQYVVMYANKKILSKHVIIIWFRIMLKNSSWRCPFSNNLLETCWTYLQTYKKIFSTSRY